MMKRLLHIIMLMAYVVTFSACKPDPETEPNDPTTPTTPSTNQYEFKITKPIDKILNFSSELNSADISFSSPEEWTAEVLGDPSWCSIDKGRGGYGDNNTLKVSVSRNEEYEKRDAKIRIQTVKSKQILDVTVNQSWKDALTVSSSLFEISADGGEVVIETSSNDGDFEYQIDPKADWVTIKHNPTRALSSYEFVFDVAKNEDTKSREATITFSRGECQEVVTIYQRGAATSLVLSKSEYNISYAGGTLEIAVTSNIGVSMRGLEDYDWITENVSRVGMSTHLLYLDIAPNPEDEAREAYVTIVSDDGRNESEIKIIQSPKGVLVVAKPTYNIDSNGGDIDVEISHNLDFDIEISDNWITQAATRALQETTLSFNIAANTSNDSREGTIKFISKDKNISQTIVIYQSQANALIVSKKDIVIDETQQTVEFEVRSNVEYTVSDPSASWLHRESTRAMTSQTIRYRVDANSTYNSRTATITVQSKDGSLKETIIVTQAQKDAIVIAPETIQVDNEGENITLKVGHNVDYDVEILNNWITKVSTRAWEEDELTFNIAANASNDSREGTIKFTSKDKSITQTVKVYQSQSNALIVSKKNIAIDEKQQTVEFEVRANVEYTVSASSASWLHREDTRAMTSQTIRYRVDANSSYDSRTATITIQSKDGSLKETITITQMQKDAIVVAPETIQVDNDGEEFEIEVGHNVEFDVEISQDWITSAATRAFETETLTFVVAANPTEDSREGTIKFISKDKSITQTVTVVQMYDTTKPRKNEIWYTSTDGQVVNPYDADVFGANIISNTYEDGKGVITFDGPITTIGVSAFDGCNSLTSVTIPDSITAIGDSAFLYCTSLTSITIPDSVTEIGESAFFSCRSLTSVTIGNSVTTIGYGAFDDCRSLTSISIPDSVTKIGGSAFSSCSSLTTITIPDSITAIGDRAFLYCTSLTSITIPDSVTTIGEFAFFSCSSLTNITIPDSVTTIGDDAFWHCSSLTSVTIGNSVTTIGEFAFDGCNSLTSVTIGNSVTTIRYGAFRNCSSLTSVTIPDSVTTIGVSAFDGCNSLTSVTIGNSVTTIGYGAFDDCSSLKAFDGKFATADNRCLVIDGVLNSFAPANLTSYTIPDSVTTIGNGAFRNCSSLTSVNIPDSVTTIGNGAFRNCSSLTSVNIPDSVTTIGMYAFSDCSSLKSVYCSPQTPPTAEYEGYSSWDAFDDNASGRKIYVPYSSVEAYKAADGWKEYADAIVIDPATESKPQNNEIWYYTTDGNPIKLYRDADISSNRAYDVFGASVQGNEHERVGQKFVIKFTGTVTRIGGHSGSDGLAFSECTTISRIVIPDSVKEIGDSAFKGCTSLEDINLPQSVASIGKNAFTNCSKLSNITIPDAVTEIKEYTFSNCQALEEITIPAGIKAVYGYAFSDCKNLVKLHCLPIVPPTAYGFTGLNPQWTAFKGKNSALKIYVPAGSVNAYKSADGWKAQQIISEGAGDG